MGSFLPFIAVPALYAVLFLCAGGTFRAAASFLRKHLPTLASCASDETVYRALLIVLAADVIGAALQYRTLTGDTAARGYLTRAEYGSADDTAELEVTVDGEVHEVDLTVQSRRMSAGEISAVLDEAEKQLPALVFGSQSPGHVDRGVRLPEKIGDLPVKISWMTDRPDVLDWEGEIGPAAAEEGSAVKLAAELLCEEEIRTVTYDLTVFPRQRSGEEAFLEEVTSAIEAENDATEETVTLPGTIGSSSASWSTRNGNDGMSFLMLGLLIAVLLVYSEVRRKETREKERTEQMRLDYPNIVSKLVLLTSAGMSLRHAFARIRDDYRRTLAAGGRVKPGYEEIVRTSQEMEHGVPEAEAYANLGKRCRGREYRTFATLLCQSVTRGGSEMNGILRREASEAVEERKKRARVLGEEAGTKLLLPMLLMLVIVMAVLMVPALIAFM